MQRFFIYLCVGFALMLWAAAPLGCGDDSVTPDGDSDMSADGDDADLPDADSDADLPEGDKDIDTEGVDGDAADPEPEAGDDTDDPAETDILPDTEPDSDGDIEADAETDPEPEPDPEPVCTLGQRRCVEELTVEVCINNEWQTETTCGEELGESCDNERVRCLTPCQAAMADFYSNLGCVFWPLSLANYGNEGYDGGSTEPKYAGVKLFISNPNDEAVTIALTDHALSFDLGENATVPAGGAVTILLPETAGDVVTDTHVVDGNTLGYRGYRLEASLPVFVYQFNPNRINTASSDASLLLPERLLGQQYHVMTVPHSYKRAVGNTYEHPAGFTVTATRDNTTVTVTPTAPTGAIVIPPDDDTAAAETHETQALETGVARSFTLNAYEVLSLETAGGSYCTAAKERDDVHGLICIRDDDFLTGRYCDVYGRIFCQPGQDLSGTKVDSDKPVAVFGTAKNAMVPFYMFGTEHLEEQLPPSTTFGATFALGRIAPRYRYYTCSRGNLARDHTSTCPYGSGMTFYRIMASHPQTTVTIRTPQESLTIEEAPKDFNYNNQVDWVTNPEDQYWNSVIAGQTCAIDGDYCVVQLHLDEGQVVSFGDVFNHFVTADKAIMIARLIPSEEYVGIPSYTTPQAYQEVLQFKGGDPAMTYVIPADQFRSSYALNVVGELRYGYLGLVATAGTRIILDGGTDAEVILDTGDGTWETAGIHASGTVYMTRFYEIHNMSSRDAPREIEGSVYSDVKQGGGYHTLRSEGGELFGVEVYGFDHYVSYAYPGGLNLKWINQFR